MKNCLTYVLLLSLYLFSCNTGNNEHQINITDNTAVEEKTSAKIDYNKLIIGKWKPSFEETASRLTEDNNNNLKNDLSSFKKTFEAMNYEYKEGGKYLYNVGVVPQEDNTIWKITGNTLEIREEEIIFFSYDIIELSAERMILRSKNEDEIFPEIVYKKLK
jgi:hypothetical protein